MLKYCKAFYVKMSHNEAFLCPGEDGGVYVSDSAPESDSWVHREKDFVCFMSSLPGEKREEEKK